MSQFEVELPANLEPMGVFILYKMDEAHQGAVYRIASPAVKQGAMVTFKNASGNYLAWDPDNGSPLEQRFEDDSDRTVFTSDEAICEVITTDSGDFFYVVHDSSDDSAYPVTYNLRVTQESAGASDEATLRWDADKKQFRVVLQGIHNQRFAMAFRKENFEEAVVLESSETGESYTMVGDAPIYWVQDPYAGQDAKTVTFKISEPSGSPIEVMGSDDGDLDIEPPGSSV